MSLAPSTGVEQAVAAGMEDALHLLEDLIRIPSISTAGHPMAPLGEAAQLTSETLLRLGADRAKVIDREGHAPVVYAEVDAPPGAPSVLLYAHYDVQPPGSLEAWSREPFEPTYEDGLLWGRGAADNKSGIIVHALALSALRDQRRARVQLLIEGEEETSSELLTSLLVEKAIDLDADAVLDTDSVGRRRGEPCLTMSLRGCAEVDVRVRTHASPLHSGIFGGAVPDATTALLVGLGSLYDERGRNAVEGLEADEWPGEAVDEGDLRARAGMLPCVELEDEADLASQLFTSPCMTVIGMDVPRVDGAPSVLSPEARARLSIRVAPSADPVAAQRRVAEHLRRHVPFNASVDISLGTPGSGYLGDRDGRIHRLAVESLKTAYRTEPYVTGSGGSSPLIASLSRALPAAEIIMWGAMNDSTSNIHAPNENVDPEEIERLACAEALLISSLPEPARGGAGR